MRNRIRIGTGLAVLVLLMTVGERPKAQTVPSYDQAAVAGRGYFYVGGSYVGGSYVGDAGKKVMHGQMYVEVLTPREARHPFPLVLIHGAAQTATNWMGTPDGRPGWADFFVGQGYTVYMIDQAVRGRSAWQPEIDGKLTTFPAERIEQLFTTPEILRNSPPAKNHTHSPAAAPIP